MNYVVNKQRNRIGVVDLVDLVVQHMNAAIIPAVSRHAQLEKSNKMQLQNLHGFPNRETHGVGFI